MIYDDDWNFYQSFNPEEKPLPEFKVGDKVYYLGRRNEPGIVKKIRENPKEYLIEYKASWGDMIQESWQDGRNWMSKFTCNHTWKPYIGLGRAHRDEYCTECGEIREWQK